MRRMRWPESNYDHLKVWESGNCFRPGIYIIINKWNTKYYIGSSINVGNRLRTHYNALRKKTHENSYLQRAWNKYGPFVFKFNVILYCNKRELLLQEQKFIDLFQASSVGYNLSPSANGTLGYRYTSEQKKRISNSLRGKPCWNKGKTGIFSSQTLERMAEAKRNTIPWNKGVPRTPEEKRKMSENKKGQPAWNKGKKMPPHVGQKIAEANRTRVWKEETRKKMSEGRKGRKLTKEHSKKISERLKGHTVSEETKKKISDSLKQKYKEER